jgi:hypothetical protein
MKRLPLNTPVDQGIGPGTNDVLEVCQNIKLSCSELYHYFADIFKDDRGSLLLWLKTAMEDENHYRMLELCAKLRRKKVAESVNVDLMDAEITLIYILALIEKVKRCPPTIKEALLAAIDLEQKLEGFAVGHIISFTDSSYEKLFLAIGDIDSERLGSFRRAYDETVLKE